MNKIFEHNCDSNGIKWKGRNVVFSNSNKLYRFDAENNEVELIKEVSENIEAFDWINEDVIIFTTNFIELNEKKIPFFVDENYIMEGDKIYSSFCNGGGSVYGVLDLKSHQFQKIPLEDELTHSFYVERSKYLIDIDRKNRTLKCFNKYNGDRIWTFSVKEIGDFKIGSRFINQGNYFLLNLLENQLICLNIETGNVIWSHDDAIDINSNFILNDNDTISCFQELKYLKINVKNGKVVLNEDLQSYFDDYKLVGAFFIDANTIIFLDRTDRFNCKIGVFNLLTKKVFYQELNEGVSSENFIKSENFIAIKSKENKLSIFDLEN